MSLRSALSDLMKVLPNEVLEIDREVSTEYEITAFAEELSLQSPVLVFKRVKNYPQFTVISNMFSSREKIAAYLGVKKEELNKKWVSIISRDYSYSISNGDGPVREIQIVIKTGEFISFRRSPTSQINLIPLAQLFGGGRHKKSAAGRLGREVSPEDFIKVAEEFFEKISGVLP
ncbi:MAG: UbiD family decarboxylase [Nitrososphaeria archaeon]